MLHCRFLFYFARRKLFTFVDIFEIAFVTKNQGFELQLIDGRDSDSTRLSNETGAPVSTLMSLVRMISFVVIFAPVSITCLNRLIVVCRVFFFTMQNETCSHLSMYLKSHCYKIHRDLNNDLLTGVIPTELGFLTKLAHL
jgi:hypothetical protein